MDKTCRENANKYSLLMICVLSSFCVLTFCSKCSFLYPFQDGMDVNCFFTVGKALTHGKVLYRDIYEHKGLILYIIYAFAYLISNDSFIGIFALEVLCGTIFLYYSYKIVLLLKGKSGIWWIPLFAFLIYSGYSFSYGGQPEELVLPILSWTLYTFLYYMLRMDHSKNIVPLKVVFWMGLWCAVLFWIKYTLTGMFLALALFMIVLQVQEKNFYYLLKCMLAFFAGFLTVSVPVFLYFIMNGALDDLWQVYFYNMIFRYNGREIGMSRIEYSIRKVLLTFWRNKRYSLLIVLGVLWCTFQRSVKINKRTKLGIWMICFITTAGIFYSKQFNRYWGEVLAVFAPLGVTAFLGLSENIVQKNTGFKVQEQKGRIISSLLFTGSLLGAMTLSYYFSMNAYLLKYEKHEMPQYIFYEIIKEDGIENPNVLNYKCLDLGLYTVLNIDPACKYFCDYNIDLPEIYETQEQMILSGELDYIVMREPLQIAEDLYEEAGRVQFEMEFESYYQYYYLYRLKN